jgi:hypothetical protein
MTAPLFSSSLSRVAVLAMIFSLIFLVAPPVQVAVAQQSNSTATPLCGISPALPLAPANVTVLVEGSAVVSAAAFEQAKAAAVALAGALEAQGAGSQTALLEYSAFPCAAATQCTPFVASALRLADLAASVGRSFGVVSRPSLALDEARARDADYVVLLAVSPPFDNATFAAAVALLQSGGARLHIAAVGEQTARSYRQLLAASALQAQVSAIPSFASLTAEEADMWSALAERIGCPGAPIKVEGGPGKALRS